MAVLENSRRRIERATYVPLKRTSVSSGQVTRTLEKLAFINSLAIRKGEIDALAVPEHDGSKVHASKVLEALATLAGEPGRAGRDKAAVILRDVPVDELVKVGRRLARCRHRAPSELQEVIAEIKKRASSSRGTNDGEHLGHGAPSANSGLLEWAKDTNPELAQRASSLLDLMGGVTYDEDSADWEVAPDDAAACRANSASVLSGAFEESMKIEPIGRLHLERLELTPAAIRRGELVYSLPLAPQEQRRVTHREWSIRTEEFEQIIEEQTESQEEQSVNEKRELATSAESQSRRQTAFSLTASYTGLTVSGSASAETSAEDADTHRQSRADSMDMTRKASSRSRRDHKVSFRTTTVGGAETEEHNVLVNPSSTEGMRLDYFRLLREWQVELYRYGLRMTYDIVIPHPGLAMLETVAELRRADRRLAEPFKFDVSIDMVTEDTYQDLGRRYGVLLPEPPPPTIRLEEEFTFAGQGDQLVYSPLEFNIDPDYVVAAAGAECRFDVHLDPLDERAVYLDVVGQTGQAISTDNNDPAQDPDDFQLHLDVDLPKLVGRTGNVKVIMVRRELGDGSVTVRFMLELRPGVLAQWRNATWMALREAAVEEWGVQRQMLLGRVEQLQTEIEAYDALTLRKMEREAIMRGVLQWLFGPDFEVGLEASCAHHGGGEGVDPVDPSNWAAWQRVAEYGELIRFLQHAIEWENVIYLGYPYFWDVPSNWDVKATLRHPDFRHQEFLRAGFFRVVLTVRPGFEDQLIALTEVGVLYSAAGILGQDHPYVSIAEDIRNTTARLYTAESLNAESSDLDAQERAERGRLIGKWREYTPVSGLDLAVNTTLDSIA